MEDFSSLLIAGAAIGGITWLLWNPVKKPVNALEMKGTSKGPEGTSKYPVKKPRGPPQGVKVEDQELTKIWLNNHGIAYISYIPSNHRWEFVDDLKMGERANLWNLFQYLHYDHDMGVLYWNTGIRVNPDDADEVFKIQRMLLGYGLDSWYNDDAPSRQQRFIVDRRSLSAAGAERVHEV